MSHVTQTHKRRYFELEKRTNESLELVRASKNIEVKYGWTERLRLVTKIQILLVEITKKEHALKKKISQSMLKNHMQKFTKLCGPFYLTFVTTHSTFFSQFK